MKNEVSVMESHVSKLAQNIIGSEIIKLANEVNQKIKQGEKIYNLTIGDFNPKVFSIPHPLKQLITEAYEDDQTNYPTADGLLELREAVSNLLETREGLSYAPDEIVITGGARPAIYTIFKALVNPGDGVIFPVPSWNNNHYVYLNEAKPLVIHTSPENRFMPTAEEIAVHIADATLIALCSPLNPTGTTFSKDELSAICDLVVAENKKREIAGKRPVFVMYDQIYWPLTFGTNTHYNPVSINPEMRNYTLFVDGISKSLAATGVRVGWTMGPKAVIAKIKSILTHVGAWAPKAEQVASARFLFNLSQYDSFLTEMKGKVNQRLVGLYNGFKELRAEGFPVEAIAPEGAIYLTVQFALKGHILSNGEKIVSTQQITSFLLNEAKIAVVPFSAFGAEEESTWYRISVGTCKEEDVAGIISNLRKALILLK